MTNDPAAFNSLIMELFHRTVASPLGNILLQSDKDSLLLLQFLGEASVQDSRIPEILGKAAIQLDEYFGGSRRVFDLALSVEGTDFQERVWQLVQQVEYGKTSSYGELANHLGSSVFSRAVGLANGKNPIPIIIPCHRIIGSSGKLTGYSGGLERKKWLLLHEQQHRNELLF